MLELKGKYNTAKVFTDNVDEATIGQVIELLNQEVVKDSNIRIMPDTHAGKGCVIGTTMTITDKVIPNLVGVDIGCGMETVKISNNSIDFDELDKVIRSKVPSGFNVNQHSHPFAKYVDFSKVIAPIDSQRASQSIGTLGGGK